MRTLNISQMTAPQIQILTGCTPQIIERLMAFCMTSMRRRLGRPVTHWIDVQFRITLMKLRHNLTYRAIESITGIDAVTASRIVRRVLGLLSPATMPTADPPIFLVVDATISRVGTTLPRFYSGYKHHRGLKTQIVCDEKRFIRHVSPPQPASVHDKKLWDEQCHHLAQMKPVFVLADKGYAGAILTKAVLRPLKRNESAYRNNPARAKQENRIVSALRVRIEHVIGSLKRFKILAERFPLALACYSGCMHAIALIHNLQLEIKLAGEL
jgi:hypothetical protein